MRQAAHSIAHNLGALRQTIADAARSAGRHSEDVRLIAVSKTHSAAAIEAAIAAGQREFGENTVQEAMTKIPRFADRLLTWHFVGYLQSNKAKFIPGNFSWLHSLDSVKLAERVSRVAVSTDAVVNTLVEVNITRDPATHGIVPEMLYALLDDLVKRELPGIKLRGLMAMGPHPASESEVRAAFANLRELRDMCRQRFGITDFAELSMGMSGDYVEAIKEGSTMVRIGTAIFGERIYAE